MDEDTKKTVNMSRFKKARLLYQLKMFEQSLEELNVLVENDPNNSKVHFYMGKILSRNDPHTEAVLHFEQVIRLNEDPFFS